MLPRRTPLHVRLPDPDCAVTVPTAVPVMLREQVAASVELAVTVDEASSIVSIRIAADAIRIDSGLRRPALLSCPSLDVEAPKAPPMRPYVGGNSFIGRYSIEIQSLCIFRQHPGVERSMGVKRCENGRRA